MVNILIIQINTKTTNSTQSWSMILLIFSKGCFREGYDYLTSEYTLKINVETARKCQALCQEDSRCWRFTHLGGSNATECYLIYDNEATVSTLLDGAVSGPKYCQRKP